MGFNQNGTLSPDDMSRTFKREKLDIVCIVDHRRTGNFMDARGVEGYKQWSFGIGKQGQPGGVAILVSIRSGLADAVQTCTLGTIVGRFMSIRLTHPDLDLWITVVYAFPEAKRDAVSYNADMERNEQLWQAVQAHIPHRLPKRCGKILYTDGNCGIGRRAGAVGDLGSTQLTLNGQGVRRICEDSTTPNATGEHVFGKHETRLLY